MKWRIFVLSLAGIVVIICSSAGLAVDRLVPGDFDRDGAVGLSDVVVFADDWLGVTSWHEN